MMCYLRTCSCAPPLRRPYKWHPVGGRHDINVKVRRKVHIVCTGRGLYECLIYDPPPPNSSCVKIKKVGVTTQSPRDYPSVHSVSSSQPFGCLSQCFDWTAAPINMPSLGPVTLQKCPGRVVLLRKSFTLSIFVFCNYHSIEESLSNYRQAPAETNHRALT